MVDLRDALRPFVDEAAAAPRRTVAEVAERAELDRRRRIRRRSAVAGLATVLVAVAAGMAVLGSQGPSDDVSTVDPAAATSSTSADTTPATDGTPSTTAPDPGPATTAPPPTTTTAPTTATTTPPTEPIEPTEPAASDAPLVSLVDGVVATSTTTSDWENGYCVQVRVENTTAAPVEWAVRYALGGSVATFWNAVVDEQRGGTAVFTGEDGYNRELAPGASTTFGTCVDT